MANLHVGVQVQLSQLNNLVRIIQQVSKSFSQAATQIANTNRMIQQSYASMGQSAGAAGNMAASSQSRQLATSRATEFQIKQETKAYLNLVRAMNTQSFGTGGKARFSDVRRQAAFLNNQAAAYRTQVNAGVRPMMPGQPMGAGVNTPMAIGMVDRNSMRQLAMQQQQVFGQSVSAANMAAIKWGALKAPLQGVAQNMTNIGKQTQWTGRQMMTGLTIPLLMAIRATTQLYLSVSKEMTRIKKVGGADLYNKYEGVIKGDIADIVKTFGVSQKQAAQQLGDVVAMGYSIAGKNSQAAKMTKAMQFSSTLGDIGSKQGADFYRTMLKVFVEGAPGVKNFNDQIKGTNFIVDQLNQIENKTIINLNQLAEAMPRAAGAAKMFGLNAAELASVLTGIYDKGIPIETAATGLSFILQRVVNPTAKAAKTFDEAFSKTPHALQGIQTMAGGLEKLTRLSEMYVELQNRGLSKEEIADPNAKKNTAYANQVFSELVQRRQIKTFQPMAESLALGAHQIRTALKEIPAAVQDINAAGLNIDTSTFTELSKPLIQYRSQLLQSEQFTSGFGRALVASSGFVNINSESIKELASAYRSMSAKEINIKLVSPDVQMRILSETFKMVGVSIGESIFPVLLKVGHVLLSVFEGINKMGAGTKTLFGGLIVGLAVIGPLMYLGGLAFSVFGSLAGAIFKFLPGLEMIAPDTMAAMAAMGTIPPNVAQVNGSFILLDKSTTTLGGRLKSLVGIQDAQAVATRQQIAAADAVILSQEEQIAAAEAASLAAQQSDAAYILSAELKAGAVAQAETAYAAAAATHSATADLQVNAARRVTAAELEVAAAKTEVAAVGRLKTGLDTATKNALATDRKVIASKQAVLDNESVIDKLRRQISQSRITQIIAEGRAEELTAQMTINANRRKFASALEAKAIKQADVPNAVLELEIKLVDKLNTELAQQNVLIAEKKAAIEEGSATNAGLYGMESKKTRLENELLAEKKLLLDATAEAKARNDAVIAAGLEVEAADLATTTAINDSKALSAEISAENTLQDQAAIAIKQKLSQITALEAAVVDAENVALTQNAALKKLNDEYNIRLSSSTMGLTGAEAGLATAQSNLSVMMGLGTTSAHTLALAEERVAAASALVVDAMAEEMLVNLGLGESFDALAAETHYAQIAQEELRIAMASGLTGAEALAAAHLGVTEALNLEAAAAARLAARNLELAGESALSPITARPGLIARTGGLVAKGGKGLVRGVTKFIPGVSAPAWAAAPAAGTAAAEGGGLMTMMGPLLVIAAIVAALVLAFIVLKRHWKEIHAGMKSGLDAVGKAFKEVGKAVGDIIAIFSNSMKGVAGFAEEGKKTGSVWTSIGQAVSGLMIIFAKMLTLVAQLIKFLAPAFQYIANLIKPIIEFVVNLIQAITAIIHGDLSEAFDFLGRAVANVFEFVLSYMSPFLKMIDGMAKKLGGVAASIADAFGAHGTADNIRRGIKNMNIESTLRNAINNGLKKTGTQKIPYEFVPYTTQPRPSAVSVKPDPGALDPPNGSGGSGGKSAYDNFLSALQSKLNEFISKLKDLISKEFDDVWKQRLQVFDDQIKAMDAVEKKEAELIAAQEYAQSRREALNKRSLDQENYRRDRGLAIYEGRIDDARNLDLSFAENDKSNRKTITDIDKSRANVLLKASRDLQRQKIADAKKAAEDLKAIEEKALKEQIDLITKYTPKNDAEWVAMMDKINDTLTNYGMPRIAGAWNNGLDMFKLAISEVKIELSNDSFWQGEWAYKGIYNWISQLAQIDIKNIVKSMADSAAAGIAGSALDPSATPDPTTDGPTDSTTPKEESTAIPKSVTVGGWRNLLLGFAKGGYKEQAWQGILGNKKLVNWLKNDPKNKGLYEFYVSQVRANNQLGDIGAAGTAPGGLPSGFALLKRPTAAAAPAVSPAIAKLAGKVDKKRKTLKDSWSQVLMSPPTSGADLAKQERFRAWQVKNPGGTLDQFLSQEILPGAVKLPDSIEINPLSGNLQPTPAAPGTVPTMLNKRGLTKVGQAKFNTATGWKSDKNMVPLATWYAGDELQDGDGQKTKGGKMQPYWVLADGTISWVKPSVAAKRAAAAAIAGPPSGPKGPRDQARPKGPKGAMGPASEKDQLGPYVKPKGVNWKNPNNWLKWAGIDLGGAASGWAKVIGNAMTLSGKIVDAPFKAGLDIGKHLLKGLSKAFKAKGDAMDGGGNILWNALSNNGKPMDWLPIEKSAGEGLGDLFDGLQRTMRKLGKDMFNQSGVDITRGIKEGILGPQEQKKVRDAGVDTIKNISDGVKDHAKIKSPSKLFADEIGKPLVDGIAMGIESPSSKLTFKTAVKNLLDSYDSFRKTVTVILRWNLENAGGLRSGIQGIINDALAGGLTVNADVFTAAKRALYDFFMWIWDNLNAAARAADGPLSGIPARDTRVGPLQQRVLNNRINSFAEGGIVKRRMGGIIAQIGEGQYDEAVIPLPQGMSQFVNSFQPARTAPSDYSGMSVNITNNSAPATPQAVSTNIYVDNFIGEPAWFESMMKEYGVKVAPKNQQAYGTINRKVTSYQDNSQRSGRI